MLYGAAKPVVLDAQPVSTCWISAVWVWVIPAMGDFDLALSTPAKCERRLVKSDLENGIVQVPPRCRNEENKKTQFCQNKSQKGLERFESIQDPHDVLKRPLQRSSVFHYCPFLGSKSSIVVWLQAQQSLLDLQRPDNGAH